MTFHTFSNANLVSNSARKPMSCYCLGQSVANFSLDDTLKSRKKNSLYKKFKIFAEIDQFHAVFESCQSIRDTFEIFRNKFLCHDT